MSSFHARDWYTAPRVDAQGGSTYTDDFPRSRRTNICEIPNYRFAGGTIDKKTLEAIGCPKCLVMLDGYLESGELRLLPEMARHPGEQSERLEPIGAELLATRIDRRLLHGREQT